MTDIESKFYRQDAIFCQGDLERKAREIGANAVIGLSFDCGSFQRQGTNKAVCSISDYGTAVKIKTFERR